MALGCGTSDLAANDELQTLHQDGARPLIVFTLFYPVVSFSSRGLPLSSLGPGGLVPGLAGW